MPAFDVILQEAARVLVTLYIVRARGVHCSHIERRNSRDCCNSICHFILLSSPLSSSPPPAPQAEGSLGSSLYSMESLGCLKWRMRPAKLSPFFLFFCPTSTHIHMICSSQPRSLPPSHGRLSREGTNCLLFSVVDSGVQEGLFSRLCQEKP